MADNARFYMPPSELPITQPGVKGYLCAKAWYVLFSQLYTSSTDGISQQEVPIPVGPSPYSYLATIRGQLNINGGGGLTIEYTRDGTRYYPAGTAPCMIAMAKGDQVRVTYAAAPSLTFFTL